MPLTPCSCLGRLERDWLGRLVWHPVVLDPKCKHPDHGDR